ncbi:MAG: mandelate racemase/muconate lactonizing enzyme family protein [Chloroflexi bacterium]|nr:mandelate racemase/muconate lactonizing enzyme family protein [Chloroflexota bacterium]
MSMGRANAVYVRIDTDRGLTGTGETVLKRRDGSVRANLIEIGEYLVGKDALATEDHFEKLYRDTFWVGGPLHAAGRSAVDIALWDLKGQYYNAPIYQMLGGPTRDSILTYAHVACGSTPDEFAAGLRRLADRGYRGAKTGLPLFYGEKSDPTITESGYFGTPGSLDPSLKETEYLPTSVIEKIAGWFAAAREEVGWEFELMLDCHGRLNLPNAVRLVEALVPYRLLFLEEPLPPESATEYARLSARSSIPIAAGERLVSLWDVRPFLEAGSLGVLQCDVVNCGGLTGAKKIAALAESYFVPYAPHNPNGPIATLASSHLMAAIPNALVLETVGSEADLAMFAELVDYPPEIDRGVLRLTERPGLGASLLDDAPVRRPPGRFTATR